MDAGKETCISRDRMLIELVERYQEMLLHMCYVYLHDQELAKDAVQETFLRAYRGLAAFRSESSPKTWLIQIAINTCKSMRRSAWFRHHDRRITPEDLPQTAVMMEKSDLNILCDIMLLPSGLKEVIMLYYWQNMSTAEIAQSLGVAQSTVSRRLRKAREKLHQMLDGREQHGRS